MDIETVPGSPAQSRTLNNLLPPPQRSLQMGQWVKLICGASYQDMPTVRRLVMIYALAGVDCVDVAADGAVVAAARRGLEDAARLARYLGDQNHLIPGLPWLMVSLNDSEDPHFRKAHFDAAHCPPECDRPCEPICPTTAIQFQAPNHGGVATDLCYGCGRCIAVCPIDNIEAQPYLASPEAFSVEQLTQIDAVEIHTQTGHQAQFAQLWQRLLPWRPYLKLISISCPDHDQVVPYLWDLYRLMAPLGIPLIWQTDGRPMSGDLGKGTTHATIRLAQKILAGGPPGYVQPAGGTNGYTVRKLLDLALINQAPSTTLLNDPQPNGLLFPQTAGVHHHDSGLTHPSIRSSPRSTIAGIAYGSYGRSQLLPFLDAIDHDLQPWLGNASLDQSSPGQSTQNSPNGVPSATAALWQRLDDSALGKALTLATDLVGQLKVDRYFYQHGMVSYSDENSAPHDLGDNTPADNRPAPDNFAPYDLAVEFFPTEPEGTAQQQPVSAPEPAPTPAPEPPIDDLEQLLSILPPSIRARVANHSQRQSLIEVVLDLGRLPEARFYGSVEYLSDDPVTHADLDHCIKRVGSFGGDNRAGIEKTLHRISAIRNRSGEVIGLTCRVGRAIFGTIGMIRDLVETGRSILMLGRPGVGKTTALREIARVLADDLQKRVVIIDTSNEIAGDGDIPHPAIGRARRMQVAHPEEQHRVMIEAVENHMPEVIVIDEIGTELEALAARTIAERGVQLVGTAHGNQLENLIKNPTLSDLIGGIQSVTLGDEEARRRGSQKSVLERKAPPTFDIAVEMLERQRWAIHEDVTITIDNLLRGRQPGLQIRSVDENQKVLITHELPGSGREVSKPSRSGLGWRAAGQMVPPSNGVASGGTVAQRTLGNVRPLGQVYRAPEPTTDPTFAHLLDMVDDGDIVGPNGEDAMRLYPYGLSRHQIERVIQTLHMPVVITKDLDNADAVLALRSHAKAQAKLKHMAQGLQIPVHLVKSNSIPQITRALQRLLDLDDNPAAIDLGLFSHSGGDDELEALEEARLAVEQIVIPKGQPVELLPRSAHIRKMQHELAEHYRLKSLSCGEEPNRRLRIYPA